MISSSIQYPSDVRHCGVRGRWGSRCVRWLDRAGPGTGAASQVLARHHLWRVLQDGPPKRRPSEKLLALSFDLDYQADTDALPPLLTVLDDAGVAASVVAIGKWVARDPEPYREAVSAGHEIVNHTWSHPDNPVLNPDREFWDLTQAEMVEEMKRAQDAFDTHLGVRPSGFRTPHFKDAPRMIGALQAVSELTYASSTLTTQTPTGLPYLLAQSRILGDDTHLASPADPRSATDLMMVPLTPCPDHPWTPFDTWHALRRPSDERPGPGHHSLDAYLDLWQRMLRRHDEDGFASVYFDPMDVMRDDDTRAVFADMLAYAVNEGWTVTTLASVAQQWREVVEHRATPAAV